MSDLREFREDTRSHQLEHQRNRQRREDDRHLHEILARAQARDVLRRETEWSGVIVILAMGFWIGLVLAGWVLGW